MVDWSTGIQALIGLAILVVTGCFAAAYLQFLRGKYYFEREEGGRRTRNLGCLLVFLLLLLLGVRASTPWLNPFVADLARRLAWERPGLRPTTGPPPPPTALPSPPSPAGPPTASPTSPAGLPTVSPTPSPPALGTHATPAPQTPPTSTPTPSPRSTVQGEHFRLLTLARGIDADKRPVDEGPPFSLDDRPVYVFFTYRGMANGMRWTQEWRRGDEVLGGEEALWGWGSAGRAWVYFLPPFGWSAGTYEVRLYVEGRLEVSAEFTLE